MIRAGVVLLLGWAVLLASAAGPVEARGSGASYGRSAGSHFREDRFGTRRNYRMERQVRLPRSQHQRLPRMLLPGRP